MHGNSDLDVGPRDVALCAVLVGGVAFAAFPQRKAIALLGWVGCLAFTLLSGSRIASAVLLAMPILHLGYRTLRWNIVGVVVAAVVAVFMFYTPVVQERFFYSGHGEFADLFSEDVNGAGRFDAWPFVWDEAWKHPWFGAVMAPSANSCRPSGRRCRTFTTTICELVLNLGWLV